MVFRNLSLGAALWFGWAMTPEALACQPIPGEIYPTNEVLWNRAGVIVAGKISAITNDQGERVARIDIEKFIRGAPDGRTSLDVTYYSYRCNLPSLPEFSVGDWFQFALQGTGPRLYIDAVKSHCPSGMTAEAGAPLGHCNMVLKNSAKIGRFEMAKGSTLLLPPDRNMEKPYAALLARGSAWHGLSIPEGTQVFPMRQEMVFKQPTNVGPLTLSGRVFLGVIDPNVADGKIIHAAERDDGSPEGKGTVTLEGARVYSAELKVPELTPRSAIPHPGVRFRGYVVQDYLHFSSSGELTEFRAASQQIVQGVVVKKCDGVRMEAGRLVQPFQNQCR